MKRNGLTLLEVLIATLIMGVAVVGLLSAISTSMRSAARLTDYDRVAILAKAQMDALRLNFHLPPFSVIGGEFDSASTGGVQAGWRARTTPFDTAAGRSAGTQILERIELEIWWMSGQQRRTFTLEAFRRRQLRAADVAAMGQASP